MLVSDTLLILLSFSTIGYIEAAVIITAIEPRGIVAEAGQFPYHVGLRNKNVDESLLMCGGSIIGPRHVITQAICTLFLSNDFNVIAGCVDYNGDNCQTYEVDKVIQHPNFESVFQNNLAVIVVTENFVLNDNVQIIELARERIDGEFSAIASGWDFYTETLRWMELTTLPDEICLDTWSDKIPPEQPAFVCTLSESYAVMGNWGGPLVVNGSQIGVIGTSDKNTTDIHIRTDYFLDFIDSAMNKSSTEVPEPETTPDPNSSTRVNYALLTCFLSILVTLSLH